MCEYCDGKCKFILHGRTEYSKKGDFYPGVDVWIEPVNKRICIDAVADVYEPHYIEERIQIRFCPMCGKEL